MSERRWSVLPLLCCTVLALGRCGGTGGGILGTGELVGLPDAPGGARDGWVAPDVARHDAGVLGDARAAGDGADGLAGDDGFPDGGRADGGDVTAGRDVADVPAAPDGPVTADAPPGTDVPVLRDVPPVDDVRPPADVPAVDDVPLTADVPPVDDVPLPADVPPVADVPVLRDIPPVEDVPLVADVPPVADVLPVDDVPPVADVPLVADVPPVADVPVPADVPLPPAGVRVATWNVHLLWDDLCDSGRCGSGDFEEALSPAAFEARADEVAAGILGLEADVVCLQEVESQRALDRVAARLGAALPVVVLGESGWPASLDVAVVARGRLVQVRRHGAIPIPLPGGGSTWFTREFLEVHVDVDGAPVVVFCAHFKSQHDDDPARRLAEAEAAHELVTATALEQPGALVVLAGDLNDVPGSAPIDALEGSGRLLRVAAAELPGDAAGTYWFDGPRALDHLFQALDAGGAYVSGTVTVVVDHPEWLRYGGSDHAALRAGFAW